jgi:hypothetical protein
MVSNSSASSVDPDTPIPSAVNVRVELLSEVRPTEAGIVHRRGGEIRLLEWSRVAHAVAAEVGEPQGVRTIVFDLTLETDGEACVVFRFDADPSGDAREIARAIAASLPPERTGGSVKSIASDGVASRWYPDLESFEEANRRGAP